MRYLHAIPKQSDHLEDEAAISVLGTAQRIAASTAWRSDLLDTHDARIDLFDELHAVLDAARDIADVRARVGSRPDAAYEGQWQIDTDALDSLADQVRRRAAVLVEYEGTIERIQQSIDDAAEQSRRQSAALAVDDIVKRRGGDDLLTEIAAERALEAASAEALVQEQLHAANVLKNSFDLPFSVGKRKM